MNEKQLAQIGAWLEGQHRYKLLDCERTGILKLKGALLQIWLALYMCENDDQQSWLSNAAVMRLTGIGSEHTVIDARRWLVENGWLKNTGHVAAIKYENPSQGAYLVPVVTVDNPCKNCTPAKIAVRYPKGAAKTALHKLQPPPAKFADKGSVSVSAFGSDSTSEDSACESACTSEGSIHIGSGSRVDEQAQVASLLTTSGRDENQKPNHNSKTRASASRWSQKYDAPKPDGFDTWSVSARAMWVENHRSRQGGLPATSGGDESQPVPTSEEGCLAASKGTSVPATAPPNSAPPPSRFKYHCPVCEYGNKYGSEVAEHIEKNHPEQGQQSFSVPCTENGCTWRTWWNKVQNNKAEMDAELLEHLESQHHPDSSRYDPWDTCKCGVPVRRSETGKHTCKAAA